MGTGGAAAAVGGISQLTNKGLGNPYFFTSDAKAEDMQQDARTSIFDGQTLLVRSLRMPSKSPRRLRIPKKIK